MYVIISDQWYIQVWRFHIVQVYLLALQSDQGATAVGAIQCCVGDLYLALPLPQQVFQG